MKLCRPLWTVVEALSLLCVVSVLASSASAKDITLSPGDSLAKARDEARSGDRIILHGGTYPLTQTLILGPQNSGVTWMAAPGETPVISGGIPVTGWTPDKNGIWMAKLDRADKLRQLYVNGRPADMASYKPLSPVTTGWRGTFTITGKEPWALDPGSGAEGIAFKKSEFPQVAHPEDLEIQQAGTWTTIRIDLTGIRTTDSEVIALLAQPLGAIAQTLKEGEWGVRQSTLYNAYEFLIRPGQFYFDRSHKAVYYMPRLDKSGQPEDMTKAEVIAPTVETLLSVHGNNLKEHVSNLRFEGLTFAHTSWRMQKVGDSYGSVMSQSTALHVKFMARNGHALMYQDTDIPAAAVEVNSADHITFQRDMFTLTGSIGLNLENDVRDSAVTGNIFLYTGSAGLDIGHPQHVYIGKQNGDNEGFGPYNIDNSHAKWDESVEGLCQNLEIADNLFRWTCDPYWSGCALTLYYGHDITIEHNDIARSPYSGMQIGWGWEMWSAKHTKNKPSLSLRNIAVRDNRVGRVMEKLGDGGGIYLLAQQVPTAKDPAQQQYSDISGNYIYSINDLPSLNGFWCRGIHPDNGTCYMAFTHNVFDEVPYTIELRYYGGKGNFRFSHNFSNSPFLLRLADYEALAIPVEAEDNTVVEATQWPSATNTIWPPEALKIMTDAGLEPAYRDLLEKTGP